MVLRQLTDKNLIGIEIGKGNRKQGRIIGTSLAASPLPDFDIVLGLQISITSQILLPKEATIFIYGSLDFEPETGRLSVGTFKIDAKSKNFLLDKTLEIFANRIYYRKVLDKATYNLNTLISPYLTTLNERMKSGMPLSQGIVLKGNLKNIAIIRIEPLTEHILVHAHFKGATEVDILEIPDTDYKP